MKSLEPVAENNIARSKKKKKDFREAMRNTQAH